MGPQIESHRDLICWQKAIDLITECYSITKRFPSDERFGITQQINRSAVSVAANIAEGKGRGTSADFARFLAIAMGSLCELDTHFVVAMRLNYINAEICKAISTRIEELGKIITGLRKSLQR